MKVKTVALGGLVIATILGGRMSNAMEKKHVTLGWVPTQDRRGVEIPVPAFRLVRKRQGMQEVRPVVMKAKLRIPKHNSVPANISDLSGLQLLASVCFHADLARRSVCKVRLRPLGTIYS